MSRILLKTYEEVVRDPEKFKLQEEIFNALTETEKNLARTMLLVNIIGAFLLSTIFLYNSFLEFSIINLECRY